MLSRAGFGTLAQVQELEIWKRAELIAMLREEQEAIEKKLRGG